jgi:hypothetical protein
MPPARSAAGLAPGHDYRFPLKQLNQDPFHFVTTLVNR